MENPELYYKTVDILVQAYFNDTLRHGKCTACAVGNLVAYHMGYTYNYNLGWSEGNSKWTSVFYTVFGEQYIMPIGYNGDAKVEIESTGYQWEELAKVEYAFECAPYGKNDDEWMFNGLMAVIEALDQIHENTDTQVTTISKNKFNKQLQPIT